MSQRGRRRRPTDTQQLAFDGPRVPGATACARTEPEYYVKRRCPSTRRRRAVIVRFSEAVRTACYGSRFISEAPPATPSRRCAARRSASVSFPRGPLSMRDAACTATRPTIPNDGVAGRGGCMCSVSTDASRGDTPLYERVTVAATTTPDAARRRPAPASARAVPARQLRSRPRTARHGRPGRTCSQETTGRQVCLAGAVAGAARPWQGARVGAKTRSRSTQSIALPECYRYGHRRR